MHLVDANTSKPRDEYEKLNPRLKLAVFLLGELLGSLRTKLFAGESLGL